MHFETRTPQGDPKKQSKAQRLYAVLDNGNAFELALDPTNQSLHVRKIHRKREKDLEVRISPRYANSLEIR